MNSCSFCWKHRQVPLECFLAKSCKLGRSCSHQMMQTWTTLPSINSGYWCLPTHVCQREEKKSAEDITRNSWQKSSPVLFKLYSTAHVQPWETLQNKQQDPGYFKGVHPLPFYHSLLHQLEFFTLIQSTQASVVLIRKGRAADNKGNNIRGKHFHR